MVWGSTSATSNEVEIWQQWCTADSCTATSATTSIVWSAWSTYYTDNSTTAATTAWTSWNGAVGYDRPRPFWGGKLIGYQETPGERADRLAREQAAAAEYQARQEKEQKERRAADAKAEALLRSLLRPEQIATYERQGVIIEYVEGEVTCPKTGKILKGRREYELSKALHGNIVRKENGKALERFCVYVPEVPLADHLAGQLLHLRIDEPELRRRANITELH